MSKIAAHEVDHLRAIMRRLIKQQLVRTVTDRDGNHAIESAFDGSAALSPDEAAALRKLVLE